MAPDETKQPITAFFSGRYNYPKIIHRTYIIMLNIFFTWISPCFFSYFHVFPSVAPPFSLPLSSLFSVPLQLREKLQRQLVTLVTLHGFLSNWATSLSQALPPSVSQSIMRFPPKRPLWPLSGQLWGVCSPQALGTNLHIIELVLGG